MQCKISSDNHSIYCLCHAFQRPETKSQTDQIIFSSMGQSSVSSADLPHGRGDQIMATWICAVQVARSRLGGSAGSAGSGSKGKQDAGSFYGPSSGAHALPEHVALLVCMRHSHPGSMLHTPWSNSSCWHVSTSYGRHCSCICSIALCASNKSWQWM